MLAPGGEIVSREPWLDLALESTRMYPDYVAELESESGVRIDYRACGGIDVAFEEREWQELARRAELQRPLGIASTVLDRAALRESLPLFDRRSAGAVYYPGDAIVDPREIMRSLATVCRSGGVRVREAWRATRIRAAARSVAVEGPAETLEAPTAVLAAGAWATEIEICGTDLPALPRAFPVKGQLLGYELQPGSLGPILRRGHTYLLQRSSGFTVAGTTSEQVGFDRSVGARAAEDIQARVSDLLPWLRGRRPGAAWVGLRPAADAPGPLIHRAGDSSLWLAYGHYRNGILLAPVTAKRLREEILGGSCSRETADSG
jgi:glycine oxidase